MDNLYGDVFYKVVELRRTGEIDYIHHVLALAPAHNIMNRLVMQGTCCALYEHIIEDLTNKFLYGVVTFEGALDFGRIDLIEYECANKNRPYR